MHNSIHSPLLAPLLGFRVLTTPSSAVGADSGAAAMLAARLLLSMPGVAGVRGVLTTAPAKELPRIRLSSEPLLLLLLRSTSMPAVKAHTGSARYAAFSMRSRSETGIPCTSAAHELCTSRLHISSSHTANWKQAAQCVNNDSRANAAAQKSPDVGRPVHQQNGCTAWQGRTGCTLNGMRE